MIGLHSYRMNPVSTSDISTGCAIFVWISFLGLQTGARQCAPERMTLMSAEERLMEHLFKGYNPSARPVINSSDTVDVKLQFSLLQIQDLNVRSQVLTTTGLLILDWKDERLAWTKEVSELDEIVVHGESIWRPEFAVINGADSIYGEYKEFQAVLRSNGALRWEPGGVFKTMCSIDITYYPFDEQRCDLTFGAWSYYTTKMNLSTNSVAVNLDTYEKNGEWQITRTSAARNEFNFECCPDQKFSNIGFTIELRRRHTFYIMNVILPGILTSAVLLSIFFCIPSQKVHIGVAALLSFRLFLVNVSDTIPRTSDHVPLLGIYLACTMAITTLAMVATVIVGNLYDIKDRPVPLWAQRLFMVHVARALCMCNCFAPPTDSQSDACGGISSSTVIANSGMMQTRRGCSERNDENDDHGGEGKNQGRERSDTFRLSTLFRSPGSRAKGLGRDEGNTDVRSTSYDGHESHARLVSSTSRHGVRLAGHCGCQGERLRSESGSAVCSDCYDSGLSGRTLASGLSSEGHSASGATTNGGRRAAGDRECSAGSGGGSATVTGSAGKINYARDWAHVAAVCDRFFFWLCLIFIVATTLLLFHPLSSTMSSSNAASSEQIK